MLRLIIYDKVCGGHMDNYFKNQYKHITYPVYENNGNGSIGLRNAQIGAIHSIVSHFSLNKNAAIVVMPTGAGKTAVLMMTPFVLRVSKVLIVTPSAMVRGQIADDFKDLATLIRINVLSERILTPKVYEMMHIFKDEDIAQYTDADVIVATPACALSLSDTKWAKENITLVAIDEAHHSPAPTWQKILINLNAAFHVLFTATPFRLDKKELSGNIIYNYPLSKAYADGIFGEIKYIPVDDVDDKDILIAKKTEEIFFNDRNDGLKHFLMVRTNTKKHAEYLEGIYSDNTKLRLQRIDCSMSNRTVRKYIEKMKAEELDGIICVDMLGEGFDFPRLKIAAIHTPHKSLASTLQFIGRFARTNASNIGTAKFIAAYDEDLKIENYRLYSTDAIWQEMIIGMSEDKNQKEQNEREYCQAFENENSIENETISLHSICLNSHEKIFKAQNFNIQAEFPEECHVGNRVYRNMEDNTVVGIGVEFLTPKWLRGDKKLDKECSLFVVHYQNETGLLHIYSQKHIEVLYDLIAKAFSTKYEKIPKSEMNRVLGNMENYEFFNSGMVNRFNESGEAYRIMAGSDVSSVIDTGTGKMYSPGHVFCKATQHLNTEKEEITIGYSSASKVWSSAYKSLHDYILWCDNNGCKITDASIKVKTNTNYDLLPQPEKLLEYPSNIFFMDYSGDTYTAPPVVYLKGEEYAMGLLVDYKLSLIEYTKEYLKIKVYSQDENEIIFCDVDGKYSSVTDSISISKGNEVMSLADYLNDYPLLIRTLDDSLIQGFEIYKGVPDEMSFDQSTMGEIDWEKYNTDIHLEVSTDKKTGVSIQDTLEKHLLGLGKYKYILYDHSKGEIADFIGVYTTDTSVCVELYHVKGMGGVKYNDSVDDVYEVTGQALKSIIWLSTKAKFIEKMQSRRKSGHCKEKFGVYDDLIKELRSTSKQFIGNIYIVQPGLSKSNAMDHKIQEVLAAATTYIKRSGRVKALTIIGSK